MIQGIVVEVGDGCADYNNGPAVRVKWFDGDDSTEWAKALSLVSSS
jgi:D-arabinose 1-dehydrogenase-like Zn-dependent alcohol dehydrogenase